MKPSYKYVTAVLLAALAAGCGGSGARMQRDTTSAEYFEIAKGYMDKKDYVKAAAELKILIRRYPESSVADDALLELVKAYFNTGDYDQAVYEIKRLSRDYPESPLVEDGQYYLAMCYVEKSNKPALDQEDTRIALEELKLYLADYPGGKHLQEVKEAFALCRSKLAEKVFRTAELYARQEEYQAAVIYCEQVIEEYRDTPWYDKALELLGVCEIKMKDVQ